jgi:N-hydroxyarylamine O-acetyltransferase
MDVEAYLKRIEYDGPLDPSVETLRRLQLAHLWAVPFENLDIHLGRPIALDDASLADKIIRRRRGGFCYELNGLFSSLLRALGYRTTLLSARVAREEGVFGPEFDHLALLVDCGEPWLVDVGFGRAFREPLRVSERGEQHQHGRAYRIRPGDEHHTLLERKAPPLPWGTRYTFTLQPRELADFAETCRYHQTSPESNFTQQRTCSRATRRGRVTLVDMRLIITTDTGRSERTLTGREEYMEVLKEHFGIELL